MKPKQWKPTSAALKLWLLIILMYFSKCKVSILCAKHPAMSFLKSLWFGGPSFCCTWMRSLSREPFHGPSTTFYRMLACEYPDIQCVHKHRPDRTNGNSIIVWEQEPMLKLPWHCRWLLQETPGRFRSQIPFKEKTLWFVPEQRKDQATVKADAVRLKRLVTLNKIVFFSRLENCWKQFE